MLAILYALGMFVADLFKSRSRLEPRTCFSAINSASLYGGPDLVFDCVAVIAHYSYG
jgi:hypothetical protein